MGSILFIWFNSIIDLPINGARTNIFNHSFLAVKLWTNGEYILIISKKIIHILFDHFCSVNSWYRCLWWFLIEAQVFWWLIILIEVLVIHVGYLILIETIMVALVVEPFIVPHFGFKSRRLIDSTERHPELPDVGHWSSKLLFNLIDFEIVGSGTEITGLDELNLLHCATLN